MHYIVSLGIYVFPNFIIRSAFSSSAISLIWLKQAEDGADHEQKEIVWALTYESQVWTSSCGSTEDTGEQGLCSVGGSADTWVCVCLWWVCWDLLHWLLTNSQYQISNTQHRLPVTQHQPLFILFLHLPRSLTHTHTHASPTLRLNTHTHSASFIHPSRFLSIWQFCIILLAVADFLSQLVTDVVLLGYN